MSLFIPSPGLWVVWWVKFPQAALDLDVLRLWPAGSVYRCKIAFRLGSHHLVVYSLCGACKWCHSVCLLWAGALSLVNSENSFAIIRVVCSFVNPL